MSDKENAEGGKAPRNASVKTVRATPAKRPFSVARGNGGTSVGLDIRQKRPASAPDPLALKQISAVLGCSDNSDDNLVS